MYVTGFSSFLVSSPENVSYLTGFSGDSSSLLMVRDGAMLISDARYTIQIAETCPDVEPYIRESTETGREAIVKILKRHGGKRIGIEGGTMTVSSFETLRTDLKSQKLHVTTGWVETQRQVKDSVEIAAIRKAVACSIHAFEDLKNTLRHDIFAASLTEMEIRNRLETDMRRYGSSQPSFSTIVAVAERAALPHAVPSMKTIENGNLLLIDWGATCDGYVADLTRTLITAKHKKPSAKLRKVYQVVLDAQQAAIAAIKPGVVAKTVHEIACKVIDEAGFGPYFTHGLGHGFGRVVHESLRVGPLSDQVLRPGMVLTVEPGIYIRDWGGVRIEDNILVTNTGCEVLSAALPKEWEIV